MIHQIVYIITCYPRKPFLKNCQDVFNIGKTVNVDGNMKLFGAMPKYE